jgi:hypothetical protein
MSTFYETKLFNGEKNAQKKAHKKEQKKKEKEEEKNFQKKKINNILMLIKKLFLSCKSNSCAHYYK